MNCSPICEQANPAFMASPRGRWRRWSANSLAFQTRIFAPWRCISAPSTTRQSAKRRRSRSPSSLRRRPHQRWRRARAPAAVKLEPPPAPGVASARGPRLYEGACAVCHSVGGPPLFGSRPSLALNSNLHSAAPHNLIQVILHGISIPASSDLGYMPAFRDSMTDAQIGELVAYLRWQFAPGKPPWTDVQAAVGQVRG